MHTSLQRQQEIKIDILNKELSNKAWLLYSDGHWIWTAVTKKKERQRTDMIVLKWIQCFGLQYIVFFFQLAMRFNKVWFELSRVKLYWNDLKGNKNYFELRIGLRYRGFELLRVKLQWMYGGNPREIDFGLS